MQGSVIERKKDGHTIVRPMFAEERQKMLVRSIESATISWIVPGTWGISVGGVSIVLKEAFHRTVAMAAAMYAAPSAVFVSHADRILDFGIGIGGALLLFALFNLLSPRKI